MAKPPISKKSEKSVRLNWSAARQRLEALRDIVDNGWQLSPERVEALLKARARQLAQPLAADTAQEELEILEFVLAQQNYGIDTRFVREVYTLTDFTPVPCTPAFVIGIANVRGEMVSLLDIRKFFGLPAAGITDFNKVILVEEGAMLIGLVVDRIVEVRQLATATLQSPVNLAGIDAVYLQGVTPSRTAILNMEKILRDKTLVVDESVASA